MDKEAIIHYLVWKHGGELITLANWREVIIPANWPGGRITTEEAFDERRNPIVKVRAEAPPKIAGE